MKNAMTMYTAEEAWQELLNRRVAYYNKYLATFGGDHKALKDTADAGTFWKRKGKVKLHVPAAADIASVSASMLFGDEPRFTIFDRSLGDTEDGSQERLEEIINNNGLQMMLREAAENNSSVGDVFMKCRYDAEEATEPIIDVISGQEAVPEYRLKKLECVHFFSILKVDRKSGKIWRVYERYMPGEIYTMVYYGDSVTLGTETPDLLVDLGLEEYVTTPVDMMLAVHIANLKPSRVWPTNNKGRSDIEGMRDLLDSLDEIYTSWMRDIRLAKSRLIVPAEYLRRRPAQMDGDNGKYTFEFDEDVETLVALDIANDKNMTITPSQFAIRSEEHAKAFEYTFRTIISMSGYSPQTFGLDIKGNAESGTSRRIMEKKSFNTNTKKQGYWRHPIEKFLTAVMHLDKALYGNEKLHDDDSVKMEFSDPSANDPVEIAGAVNLLHSAQAASTETLVKMLHPDWNDKKVEEEVQKIFEEQGVMSPKIDLFQGDGEYQNLSQKNGKGQEENDDQKKPEKDEQDKGDNE